MQLCISGDLCKVGPGIVPTASVHLRQETPARVRTGYAIEEAEDAEVDLAHALKGLNGMEVRRVVCGHSRNEQVSPYVARSYLSVSRSSITSPFLQDQDIPTSAPPHPQSTRMNLSSRMGGTCLSAAVAQFVATCKS